MSTPDPDRPNPATPDPPPHQPAPPPGYSHQPVPPPPHPAPPPGPAEYAPLEDALTRVVSARPGWRCWLPPARRGAFPVVAALGVVLVLSLLGIVAPWNSEPSPARGSGNLDPGDSVLLSPSPSPADPPALQNRSEAGQNSPPAPGSPLPAGCPAPLRVAVSPDIATLLTELAGSLATGACPKVSMTSEGSAATLGTLATGAAPDADVWIPASTLSLRLASGDFPTTGTSLARSPIVIALPKPVADSLAGYPVWTLVYQQATAEDGAIPRMSMPDYRTTLGALAQVSLQKALLGFAEGDEGRAFLALINFRNHLATTQADVGALLNQLAGTAASQAGTAVGAFPATEQQLVAYYQRDTTVEIAPMGTYDANIEADYPMVVGRSLDDRLTAIADDLRAQLRSPAAVQRLVAAGFRPPDDPHLSHTTGFPAGYPNPFPADVDYPAPTDFPDRAKWQSLVDGWTWTG